MPRVALDLGRPSHIAAHEDTRRIASKEACGCEEKWQSCHELLARRVDVGDDLFPRFAAAGGESGECERGGDELQEIPPVQGERGGVGEMRGLGGEKAP